MREQWRARLEWAFLVILAVRPSLDAWTAWRWHDALRINPAALAGLAILLIGVGWFALLPKAERERVGGNALTIGLLAWVLALSPWAFLPSVLRESAQSEGFREWLRLLSLAPVCAMAFALAARGEGKRVIGALMLSLMIPACAGAYQLVFHQGALVLGLHRIQGTFAHPNPYSFYLTVLLLLTFQLWREQGRSLLWGGMAAIQLLLLAATFSFTGAIMFGVALAVLAIGASVKTRAALAGALIVFVCVFLASDTGRSRARDLLRWDNLDEVELTGQETPSHVWRLLNWRHLYREWLKAPIFGHGLNSVPRINPNLNHQAGGVGHDPHNDYMRYLVETGAIGFALWLAFLAWTGRALGRIASRAGDPIARQWAWIALALYAAWLVGSLNDNLISATAYQYTLWAIFALAAAKTRIPPIKDETECNT